MGWFAAMSPVNMHCWHSRNQLAVLLLQMQDATSAHAVELSQLRFELHHVPPRPLLDDRRIEAAELCDVKERPRAFDGRRGRCDRELIPKPVAELRQWPAEG